MARNQLVGSTRAESAERKRQVFELRKAGATWEAIAQQVGYASKSSAYKAYKSELDRLITEPAHDALQLELARLDTMNRALWPQVLKGDVQAVRAALSISERRSKFLGLDDYERRMAEVSERRVALEEQQALMVAHALANVLNGLNLTPEQRALAPELVGRELGQLSR